MTKIGTPLTITATRALLCGSGELGKEVALELQRYGVEVTAVDSCVGKALEKVEKAYNKLEVKIL